MKVFRIIVAYLILLGMSSTFLACVPSGDEAKNTYEFYMDFNQVETDDLLITIDCRERNLLEETTLSFTIDIKNKSAKQFYGNFHRAKVVRISNSAIFSVKKNLFQDEEIKIENDLTASFQCESIVPYSLKEEKYYFEIMLNRDKYVFYLYEKPDELRKKYTVSYSANGEIIQTEDVYENRSPLLTAYEDAEKCLLYENWFLDSQFQNAVPKTFQIKENITIYGKPIEMLKYACFSNMAKVTGINFVPSSGELVIPQLYKGWEVKEISNYAFGTSYKKLSGVKTIYIPKNVKIYQDLSCISDLETIYYEGTEEEWMAKSWYGTPSGVKIIYNTYK